MKRLWHGGAPGLTAGSVILPPDPGDTRHLVDGCPECEARRNGVVTGPAPGMVYVTTDREYARVYAAGYPRGDLYRVTVGIPLGDPIPDDPAPSWAVPAATVIAVYDRCVTLTDRQLRRVLRLVRS